MVKPVNIMMCMPRYSPNSANFDAAGCFQNCMHPDYGEQHGIKVHLASNMCSALCWNFNIMWAQALDLYERGEMDYFAMQHDDVIPGEYWLGKMHADVLESGVDVLSAVIPIKDDCGKTSTAVDDTGNPWRPRRIMLKQLDGLPPIFTDADVGGELLLNTGLWIAKLGPWAVEDETREHPEDRSGIHFRTYNRIVKPADGGRRRVDFIPEDWDFSRQARARGAKLAATQKITVGHAGGMIFHSAQRHGWDHDKQNAPRSPAASQEQTNGTAASHRDPAHAVLSGA